MTRHTSRRKVRPLLILLLAALAAFVVGHTMFWRSAQQNLEAGFAAWQAERRAEGWSVTSGRVTSGGWPFSARLTVPGLVLSGGKPGIPRGLTWSADRIVLDVALLHPRLLSVNAAGTQRLRLGDGPNVPYTADTFQAAIPLDPDAPPSTVDITAANLRVGVPEEASLEAGLVVANLTAHGETKSAVHAGEPVLSFVLTALDVALPPAPHGATWALGPRIASLTVDGAVNGPLPPVLGFGARASRWRDAGGTLDLRRVTVGWGPLGVTGNATLALDKAMQPTGTASVRLVGEAETLDALAANYVLAQSTATAAKAVLGLMKKAPEGGGPPEVEVPLTLQDRTLAMGHIPLVRLPELAWPEGS
jgi:hypothetical protein